MMLLTGYAASLKEYNEKVERVWIISNYQSKIQKGNTTLSVSISNRSFRNCQLYKQECCIQKGLFPDAIRYALDL